MDNRDSLPCQDLLWPPAGSPPWCSQELCCAAPSALWCTLQAAGNPEHPGAGQPWWRFPGWHSTDPSDAPQIASAPGRRSTLIFTQWGKLGKKIFFFNVDLSCIFQRDTCDELEQSKACSSLLLLLCSSPKLKSTSREDPSTRVTDWKDCIGLMSRDTAVKQCGRTWRDYARKR